MALTKKIIYAVCEDVRSKAKRQGKSFEEANDLAHEKFDELFQVVGGAEGWMDLKAA